MKKRYALVSLFIMMCTIYSCDYFETHPYAGKITGTKNINEKNIALIESRLKDSDTFRFAFISDSQRYYDELEEFVQHANQTKNIDFIMHGGDLADFGLTKELLWQRDILEKLQLPYVVIVGNHDCLANGETVFKEIFGPLNFSFKAGHTKFVCLNTNALENNYSVPIPDFNFLRNEMVYDSTTYQQTVIAMHADPTSEQFNNNVAEIFHQAIKRFPNLQYAVHGHNHRYEINNTFEDSILYYGAPAIGAKQYILFTMTKNGYTQELISF